MTGDTNKLDTAEGGKKLDNTFVILGTLADTTWRMFVPSVGFTLLGVWLDGMWGTKPWLMTAGIAMGIAGASALVMQQLKRVRGGKL